MGVYKVDGEELYPQPEAHKWDDGILGADGDGLPFRAKYRQITLSIGRLLDRQKWSQYDDGATHTITLPAPQTTGALDGDWTQYSAVYIVVGQAAVAFGQARSGGVEMRVSKVAV